MSKALEAGYRTDLMQHRFPFAVLHLTVPPAEADVNVHPSKMEVRFMEGEAIYRFIDESVHKVLSEAELIHNEQLETLAQERQRKRLEKEEEQKKLQEEPHPEPFEKARFVAEEPAPYGTEEVKGPSRIEVDDFVFEDKRMERRPPSAEQIFGLAKPKGGATSAFPDPSSQGSYVQASLFGNTDFSQEEEQKILIPDNRPRFRIIGQVFETYWLIQFEEKLLVIDQHAAHEKVNYERIMKRLENADPAGSGSQMLAPPSVITMTGREEGEYHTHEDVFKRMGYEIEPLGGASYAIRAVPMELYGNDAAELLRETLEEMVEEKMNGTPQAILAKIASMSCKAAVKGNSLLSVKEAEALVDELLKLDNPYHCPHGRPTMIAFSQAEMDKKFKRIVN